jgi:C4-dicarboxylate-specific signal transduction histidine kinase
MRSHTVLLLLIAPAVLAATAAVWLIARDAELADLRERADEALSLKQSNVVTQAERYRYLPFVLAQDERIHQLLDASDDPMLVDRTNRYLEAVDASAGSLDLFVMDRTGTTLASSNWRDETSFVGKSYKFRPYFQDAIDKEEGRYYAIGATSGVPGYFLSHRIQTATGNLGVAVVKVDMSPLERVWRDAGELAAVADRAGMIFLSSIDEWRYRPLLPLSDNDRHRILQEKQYDPASVGRRPLLPGREFAPGEDSYLQRQGKTMLVRLLDVPNHDWRILAAYDTAPVYAVANRDAAIVFLAAALLIAGGFYLREHRKHMQADRLRAILEDMSMGIAVFDAELRLVAWNSTYTRLNRYPPTLVRAGRSLAEIIQYNIERGDFGPGDPERQLRDRLESAQQQPTRQIEVRRPDGTWVEIRHSRMPGGWVIRTYSDITERKRTEVELSAHRNNLEQLVEQRTAELVQVNARLQEAVEQTDAAKRRAEQANLAKTTFLNAVSHDIRNPLNAILGYAGLVMTNAKDGLPPRQYQNLEKLTSKGRELNELVNDFLDYTRADRVSTAAFRLRPVIEECLVTIEPMIDGARVRIACDVSADLPELVQDERKLRRVVINLMSNAAKFTESGTISVGAHRRGSSVEISVADTGIGIGEEHLSRIFEEFERVEPRGERPREGTGLGLAICRRFAALMGGEIAVRSRLGEGSVFTLSVPIVHASARASDEPAATGAMPREVDGAAALGRAPAGGPGGTATVLVVDDSRANRDFLVQLLEQQYHVLVAADGKRAIEMTRLERPDIILMDLSLPIIDGWEAMRTIKRDAELRPIPIIAVTAHATQRDRQEASAAGCDGFLAKPVEERALREALLHHLGSRGAS